MTKEIKGIDLDALEQAEVAPTSDIGGLAVVSGPKVPLFPSKANEVHIDLTHLQLLYLIDISGSMVGRLEGNGRKLDLVKEVVARFLSKHFLRFPEALVSMWAFNDDAHPLCTRGSRKGVLDTLAGMTIAGDTDITQGVRCAVTEMKKALSPTKQNHIVMVSDGLDHAATQVELLANDMVASHIVFDFIFIVTNNHTLNYWGEAINAIKRTCERTGGQFVTVNDALTFEQKLLTVSGRPCLPERKG